MGWIRVVNAIGELLLELGEDPLADKLDSVEPRGFNDEILDTITNTPTGSVEPWEDGE